MFLKKGKKEIPIAALILVIAVAGCVQKEVKIDPNDGLKITEFFVDPDDVESGDLFRVYALVENHGETTARNAEVTLFGLSWIPDNVVLFSGKELTPPDAVRNRAGGFAFGQQTLKAPQLPEGISHTFKIVARATYDYATSATIGIPVFSKPEFERRKLTGGPFPTFSIDNSDGPIKVDISGNVPAVTGAGEIFYKIHIRNVGSGVPITNGITGLITGTIRIVGGAAFVDCFGVPGEKIELPQDRSGILLRKGESVDVPCSLQLDDSWEQKSQGAVLLSFDLRYKYFTEKETHLTVRGKRFAAQQPVDVTRPPAPGARFCSDAGGGCKPLCGLGETTDNTYSCENQLPGGNCCIPSGITPKPECKRASDCTKPLGFEKGDLNCEQPARGLYKSGNAKPFGNWCGETYQSVIAYYVCISNCVITEGPRSSPLSPYPPYLNECRPGC